MSKATSSSTNSGAVFWLLMWLVNNLSVTLINKAAFATIDFRYPYALSSIHMLCNMIGCQYVFHVMRSSESNLDHGDSGSEEHCVVRLLGRIQRQKLDATGRRLMLAFSVVFSLNIAIGNVSLKHVSVNFNQVMRSLVPALTIAFGFLVGRSTSKRRQLAVLPIVVGVAMSCFGDMSYTAVGLLYTIACITLAAIKVVASGEMLTGRNYRLHPVDLLGHMAPLAFIQCFTMSIVSGEVASIAARWSTDFDPINANPYPFLVVWFSGMLSFSLNISSLQANKATSPLTLCIASNVKQVLLIILSTILFHVKVTPLNASGIVVVLIGSSVYSYVSVMEKSTAAPTAAASPSESRATECKKLKLSASDSDVSLSTVSCTSVSSDDGTDDDDADLEGLDAFRKVGNDSDDDNNNDNDNFHEQVALFLMDSTPPKKESASQRIARATSSPSSHPSTVVDGGAYEKENCRRAWI